MFGNVTGGPVGIGGIVAFGNMVTNDGVEVCPGGVDIGGGNTIPPGVETAGGSTGPLGLVIAGGNTGPPKIYF